MSRAGSESMARKSCPFQKQVTFMTRYNCVSIKPSPNMKKLTLRSRRLKRNSVNVTIGGVLYFVNELPVCRPCANQPESLETRNRLLICSHPRPWLVFLLSPLRAQFYIEAVHWFPRYVRLLLIALPTVSSFSSSLTISPSPQGSWSPNFEYKIWNTRSCHECRDAH